MQTKHPIIHVPLPRLLVAALQQTHTLHPLRSVLYKADPEGPRLILFPQTPDLEPSDLLASIQQWSWPFLGGPIASATLVTNPATCKYCLVVWLSSPITTPEAFLPVSSFRYRPATGYLTGLSRPVELVSEDKSTDALELDTPKLTLPAPKDFERKTRARNIALRQALMLRFRDVSKIELRAPKGELLLSIQNTNLRSLLIHRDWILDAITEVGYEVQDRLWSLRKYRRNYKPTREKIVFYNIVVSVAASDNGTITNRFLLENERRFVQKDNSDIAAEIRQLAGDPNFLKQVQIKKLKERSDYVNAYHGKRSPGRPRKYGATLTQRQLVRELRHEMETAGKIKPAAHKKTALDSKPATP